MNVQSLLTDLHSRIAAVRRLDRRVRVQAGAIDAATIIVAVWLVVLALEAAVGWDAAMRAGLWYGAIALSIGGALACLLPPLLRAVGLVGRESNESLARRIGAAIEPIGDRLVNVLQLGRDLVPAVSYGTSTSLAEAAITSEGEPLRRHDYTVIVDRRRRRRALILFTSVLGVALLAWFGSGGRMEGAWNRLGDHSEMAATPTGAGPFTLELQPAGERRVVAGDSLQLVVRVSGAAPQRLWLLAESEGSVDSIPLSLEKDGRARHTLRDIRREMIYRAVSGPVRSAAGRVTVAERPEISRFTVVLTQPAYTGRPRTLLPDNVGDVRGLRGSSVAVKVEATLELSRAWIVQAFPRARGGADSVRLPLRVSGRTASGGFRLTRDGSYTIEVLSTDGVRNASPPRSIMAVSLDAAPTIALEEPAGDTIVMPTTMILPMGVRISDDYGFSGLRLVYTLTGSRYGEPWRQPKSIAIRIPSGSSPLLVPYIWSLLKTDMVPEDTIGFYLEVADNDVVSGPKRARTGTFVLRIPSLEEVLQEARQETRSTSTAMERMLDDARQARDEMERLNRDLTKQMAQNSGRADWQSRQKVQQLLQRQSELQQQMARMAENLRQTAEKLKEANAISPETIRKYQDLQRMFERLNDPKLLEQMQRMQQEMDRMTPEQMAEAMRNYRFNEDQFRQSVERTMEMLKRLQTEQGVDELARRAEQMAQAQQRLNEMARTPEASTPAGRERMAERQRDLARDAAQLERDAAKLAEDMKQHDGMPSEQMESAQRDLEQSGIDEAMEQAGERMERGEMQQAGEQGERAERQAKQFSERMRQMGKQMEQQGRQNVAGKMRKGMQDLLEMSKRQEELKRRTENTPENSPQFRELARQQSQLQQGMKNLTEQMMQLGRQTPAVTPEMARDLGEAMEQMGGATASLEQRDGQQASQQEGGALRSMNSAARQMGEMLGAMQQGGNQSGQQGGMGMSMGQRLQQMAAQQQMINQAMSQQMGGQSGQGQGEQGANGEGKEGKGGKNGEKGENGEGGEGEENGNGDPDGRLRRLRQQQENVQRTLEEANREAKREGGGRKTLADNLQEAAREIEEVLGEMSNGEVTPETMRRQERILSRMLEAIRSDRERDKEEKRESRPGVDRPQSSPPELRFGENREGERERTPQTAPQPQRQGYSPAYESLIRRYFQSGGR